MCPACAANAAMALVASAASTGGIASLALTIFRLKGNARRSGSKKFKQRREADGYVDAKAGAVEGRVSG